MNVLNFLYKANELMMLSSKFLIDLKNSTDPLEFKRGENFIQVNSRRSDVGFLVEGTAVELRNLDGVEYCCGLYPSGSLILPIFSMFLDEPSPVQIRFLEDSKVYILEFRTLQALQKKFDDTNYLIQFYLAHEMAERQKFAFHMRFDSPENRIKLIKEQYLQAFNLLSREQQSQLCNIQARDIPNWL